MHDDDYAALAAALAHALPAERIVADPLRRLAYGTDASFYRLIPRLVVFVQNEEEVRRVLAECRARKLPLTFRAAGTSLSGQALSDSVLLVLGDAWRAIEIQQQGTLIRLQPGVIGAEANRQLAPYGRKIGPDPASINACKIGGIAANNASGMCCGTAQNSYHTLHSMRLVLADGSVLDTGSADSRAAFAHSHGALLQELASMAAELRADTALAARIRHKFRLKNTTGYAINALLDFDEPIDILQHLMIGSEGTLGFISSITYRTVAEHAYKASALMLFADIAAACEAVTALKSQAEVAAVEFMDRTALRSVEDAPGLPLALSDLPETAAALLIEVRCESASMLASTVQGVEQVLGAFAARLLPSVAFTTDSAVCAGLWAVRKGMFPSVAALRPQGSAVIIEDVAFPVERLAEAVQALRALFQSHGYADAILFGHALEGNLHFVITPDFSDATQLVRYRDFMAALGELVVHDFDGSLKAEHGTGRNMAPFVELEWGRTAWLLMRRLKTLLDPQGLLNPDVILSEDPLLHLKHIKPLPAAHPIVDACMECGFCESKCPSHQLTFSPRQRIASWRSLAAGVAQGAPIPASFQYQGMDTCAACGLCETACPVGIGTGGLVKALRAGQTGAGRRAAGRLAATHFATTTALARLGLQAGGALAGVLGDGTMQSLAGAAGYHWTPALPRAATRREASAPVAEPDFLYFPSCSARSMGPARGAQDPRSLPDVLLGLARQAGLRLHVPPEVDALCCGMPFESKGLVDEADGKRAELLRVLARQRGLPVVFDTSPCSYRMQRGVTEGVQILDVVDFLHDHVLPRLSLRRRPGPVMLHLTCSLRMLGHESKLTALARACAEEVVIPSDVGCCGFAGDKGLTTPELNAHALRHLKAAVPAGCGEGYSSSRTCEIGLSEHAGLEYRSIAYLLDDCSRQT